jgi:hypothetical protein
MGVGNADGSESSLFLQIAFAGSLGNLYQFTLTSPDILGQQYSIVTAPGATPQSVSVTGYSLESALTTWEQKTGVASDQFTLVEIQSSTGTVLIPTAQAMSNPTTTPQAPVLWVDSKGNINYADAKPDDYVSSIPSEIWLYTGSELTAHISTTSKQSVPEGSSVTFRATVSGEASGTSPSYGWIGVSPTVGGSLGGGVTNRIKFAFYGTYYIYMVATTSDGSIGVSNQIEIDVGKTPKGPNRSGGGTTKKKTAPDRGPGTQGSLTGKTTSTQTSSQSSPSPVLKTTTTATTPKRSAVTTPTKSTRPKTITQRQAGPLLSGIAVTSSQRTTTNPAPSPRPSALGVTRPARTGHIVRTHALELSESFWLALAVLAALSGGGLFEWRGPRQLWQDARRRWHLRRPPFTSGGSVPPR